MFKAYHIKAHVIQTRSALPSSDQVMFHLIDNTESIYASVSYFDGDGNWDIHCVRADPQDMIKYLRILLGNSVLDMVVMDHTRFTEKWLTTYFGENFRKVVPIEILNDFKVWEMPWEDSIPEMDLIWLKPMVGKTLTLSTTSLEIPIIHFNMHEMMRYDRIPEVGQGAGSESASSTEMSILKLD